MSGAEVWYLSAVRFSRRVHCRLRWPIGLELTICETLARRVSSTQRRRLGSAQ